MTGLGPCWECRIVWIHAASESESGHAVMPCARHTERAQQEERVKRLEEIYETAVQISGERLERADKAEARLRAVEQQLEGTKRGCQEACARWEQAEQEAARLRALVTLQGDLIDQQANALARAHATP